MTLGTLFSNLPAVAMELVFSGWQYGAWLCWGNRLGTASQAFCDEWPAVTSQPYHRNAQQSLRHHIHGNPQKAFFYGLTFSCLMTYIYIYICRTAPLTSRSFILYIYSTNTRTEYFKHTAHSPFFPLQNAVYFIMLPFLVPVLFTF